MFSPETFLGTAVDFVGVDTDEKRKAFFVFVIILLSAEEVNDGSSAQEGREETEVHAGRGRRGRGAREEVKKVEEGEKI